MSLWTLSHSGPIVQWMFHVGLKSLIHGWTFCQGTSSSRSETLPILIPRGLRFYWVGL
jgi:hypothetical protein